MLKICYLAPSSYPEYKTGGSLYGFRLAKYFSGNAETVIIARRSQGISDDVYCYDGVCIKALCGLRFRWTKYQRLIDRNFFYPIVAYGKAKSECKDADLLHIISQCLYFPIGYSVKKRFKIPIVVSIIEDLWTKQDSFLANLYLKYERWQLEMALKYADAIIVHSDYAMQQIKENFPQYVQKVTKIYEGVDPLIVESLRERSNNLGHIAGDNGSIILVGGSLVEGKNVEVVLKATRLLKIRGFKVKLLILGSGPLKNYLEKLARKLEIEEMAIFVGEVKHEEIAKFYNLADIIIQPSRGEGSQPPPSVLEYMASGKPLIISEACDITGLLKDCVLRFNPNDENMLSKAIEKLLIDRELYEKLGEKGKEMTSECFSNEKFLREFEGIYYDLL